MALATEPLIALILEDAPRLRRRLVELIRTIDAIDNVLEAGDAPAALALALRERPQLVVLDISVPGDDTLRSGLDVLREIKRSSPLTGVVVLTNLFSSPYAHKARELGADAFLDKSTEFDQLIPTLEGLIAAWRSRAAATA